MSYCLANGVREITAMIITHFFIRLSGWPLLGCDNNKYNSTHARTSDGLVASTSGACVRPHSFECIWLSFTFRVLNEIMVGTTVAVSSITHYYGAIARHIWKPFGQTSSRTDAWSGDSGVCGARYHHSPPVRAGGALNR